MATESSTSLRLLTRLSVGFSYEIWKCEVALAGERPLAAAIRISHAFHDTKVAEKQLAQVRFIVRLGAIPGIPHYWDIGVRFGRFYVLTKLADHDCLCFLGNEHCSGVANLYSLLRRIQEAASTLDMLHERDIIHGAISPQHILVCEGHAVLTGFSLLHSYHSPLPCCDRMDLVTWSCMSPEMRHGVAELSSDQFSLAATYLALRARRVEVGDPASLQVSTSCLGACERQVILRALSESPDARFPTCAAFADELCTSVADGLSRAGSDSAIASSRGFVRSLCGLGRRLIAGGRIWRRSLNRRQRQKREAAGSEKAPRGSGSDSK